MNLTRLGDWIKRTWDRRKGPRFLELDTTPRCRMNFCGQLLTEEEIRSGGVFCATCIPTTLRRAHGAPPIVREQGMVGR